MSVIPKPIVVAAGVILLVVAALYLADKNGYSRAVADYSVEAADAAQKAKKKQAIEQIAINDLADQFYKATERENARSIEVDALKRELRKSHSRGSNGYAAYRLFNKAANSADLPDTGRTQIPDEEADGFDAIQYSVGEYGKVATQLVACIDIIASSECFNPP